MSWELTMRCIEWLDGKVRMIDQTHLPRSVVFLEVDDYRDVIEAIREMRIRGAPAIGVAGAYAVALAANGIQASDYAAFMDRLEEMAQEIAKARPTGANLRWAVQRMLQRARSETRVDEIRTALVEEGLKIQKEDEEANHRIGELGASLIPEETSILTHCNTGTLATGGYGTALGVIKGAWEQGKVDRVFTTETRPLLQGGRLTAWELVQEGIPVILIADSAAGHLMRRGDVGCVVVGADRIAANGDVANKIGTYTLAVLARENRVPFYVAAPTSTIDLGLPSGDAIPIEERSPAEVTHLAGVAVAPEGVKVRNPAFDVTPRRYIGAIITERGVVGEPYERSLRSLTEVVHA